MTLAKLSATLLCLALVASLFFLGATNLTSPETVSTLLGAVISRVGLPGTAEEQHEFEAELRQRCESEKKPEIAADNLSLRFDCGALAAGTPLEELFGLAFFEAIYYSWDCSFFDCVRTFLAGASGSEFLISKVGHDFYRKAMAVAALLAALFCVLLAATSRLKDWPRNFGLCFFIVGLGWVGIVLARAIGDRALEAYLGLSGLLASALRPLSTGLLGLLLLGAVLLLLGSWLRALEQRAALPP